MGSDVQHWSGCNFPCDLYISLKVKPRALGTNSFAMIGKIEVICCTALDKDDALIIQPYPVRATKIQSDSSRGCIGFCQVFI